MEGKANPWQQYSFWGDANGASNGGDQASANNMWAGGGGAQTARAANVCCPSRGSLSIGQNMPRGHAEPAGQSRPVGHSASVALIPSGQ
jgi:hypothetical protein